MPMPTVKCACGSNLKLDPASEGVVLGDGEGRYWEASCPGCGKRFDVTEIVELRYQLSPRD